MKKLTVFAVALPLMGALLLPGVSFAQSGDLQAQINALLAQLHALQQQLAAAQGASTVWCHTFSTNLGVGSGGSEVVALQTALQKENLMETGLRSGVYDETTASFITAFQEKYQSDVLAPVGLVNGTGYVGARTRAKLNALYGCGNVSNPAPITSFSNINNQAQTTINSTQTVPLSSIVSILYPTNNTSFTSAGPATATWTDTSNDPSAAYVVWVSDVIPISAPLGTLPDRVVFSPSLTRAQAGCSASDKCSYPLSITKVGAYRLSVTNQANGASQTVTFSIVGSSQQAPQIIYPQGGEMLQANTVNYISWNPVSYSGTFDVSIVGTVSGNSYLIAQGVAAQATDKQSIQWMPQAGGYEKDTQFIAQVCRTGTSLCSRSNGFTIRFVGQQPSSNMPSITVTAPAGAAGGQDIAPGSTYAIRWTSVGVGNVLLNLCNYYGNCIPLSNIPSVGIAASLGSFNWYVDPHNPLIPGDNLRIMVQDASSGVFGYSGYFSAGAPAQTTASTSAPFSFSISPSLVAPAGIIGYHFFGGANVNYYTLYLTCSPLVGATDPALNDMCNTTTKISSQLAAGSDYGPYGGQVNNIGSSTATVAVTATAYDANGVSLGQQTASFQISGSTQ